MLKKYRGIEERIENHIRCRNIESLETISLYISFSLNCFHLPLTPNRDIKPANILVSCVDCSVKIADFGLSRVVEVDAVASVTPPVMAQDIGDQSNCKMASGSEPTDEEDRSEADTVEMDHDHDMQYLQSPLSNHVFRDQQSHKDHEMQEQQQNRRVVASLPLPPVAAPLGLIGGFPMVPKVPLKRALTKHVVRKSDSKIHSSNAIHFAIIRNLF